MAGKVDEAENFVLVQLIEQEPGIYDKRHPDYARRDKVDLAWEKISHEMKESGMCVFVCVYIYIYYRNL
jgi:inosine/xanthosine triphosphate pyrophosphatase family protein